ncbi:MAG: 5-(carboxyamino)imidazole ribonucleotide mutase [Thermoanaerobacterales bacterium]|nr:5-(carboxyamino)imidazole ribonucleotide mutase [Bacillota bacterium]MDI6906086.1 5-(carboxyamino)imidazole ribonucleotide mutase [Thermoanaerobacterales bacterium]
MAEQKPLVGMVMGSDSDLPVVASAARTLDELGIPYEMRIISAHRTPERARDYAREAAGRGLAVLIAAAGGAAHLAGVLAAETPLPVIGLPIGTGGLGGLDALLATVQMPPGVPVATVGVDGARNAALLAAQVIGAGDPGVRERVAEFKRRQALQVQAKDEQLTALGLEEYLRRMEKKK